MPARQPSQNPIADVRQVFTRAAVSYAHDHANRPYADAWKPEPALWSRFVRFVVDWEEALEEFFASELRDYPNGAVLGPVIGIAMCGVISRPDRALQLDRPTEGTRRQLRLAGAGPGDPHGRTLTRSGRDHPTNQRDRPADAAPR